MTEFVCINSDFVQYSVSAFVLETEIVLAKKRKDSNIYILIIKGFDEDGLFSKT